MFKNLLDVVGELFYYVGILIGVFIVSVALVAVTLCLCVIPWLLYTYVFASMSPVIVGVFLATYFIILIASVRNYFDGKKNSLISRIK